MMIDETTSPQDGTAHDVTVSEDEAGWRLDRFLAGQLTDFSRSRLKALIVEGRVASAGRTIGDPGARVKCGEAYRVVVPPAVSAVPVAEPMALSIVYEDDELLVLDKPAGLVVHPAAGHPGGTLVNALLAHCGDSLSGIGGVRRPGIVHRLDKETSGLLVVAKTDRAHRHLSQQFAAHGADGRLERAYVGIVWGVPEKTAGVVDAALSRSPVNRQKIAVSLHPQARRAVTHYRVAEAFYAGAQAPVAALLRLTLETGRTHQIRVHMSHVGHPLLGDPVYAAGFAASARKLNATQQDALRALGRQALHAAVLGFEHPRTGRPLRFESPLPDDMQRLVAALRD